MQAAGHKSNLSNALIQPSKSQFVCKHFKVSSALFLCSFGHHSCEVGWEFFPSFYGRGILGSVRRSAADRPMMTLRPPLEVSARFPAPLPAPTGGSGFMELCKMIGTHRRNGRVVSGLRRAGPGRGHTWNTRHVLYHNEASSMWLSKDLRTREGEKFPREIFRTFRTRLSKAFACQINSGGINADFKCVQIPPLTH
uniref:Uncharacterized LOC104682261 n=1 Tax=Rhinopithecus roxellana TaxID=61622 RepID=A0A2K6RU01_RHIRO